MATTNAHIKIRRLLVMVVLASLALGPGSLVSAHVQFSDLTGHWSEE